MTCLTSCHDPSGAVSSTWHSLRPCTSSSAVAQLVSSAHTVSRRACTLIVALVCTNATSVSSPCAAPGRQARRDSRWTANRREAARRAEKERNARRLVPGVQPKVRGGLENVERHGAVVDQLRMKVAQIETRTEHLLRVSSQTPKTRSPMPQSKASAGSAMMRSMVSFAASSLVGTWARK